MAYLHRMICKQQGQGKQSKEHTAIMKGKKKH